MASAAVPQLAAQKQWRECLAAAVARPQDVGVWGGDYANTALHYAAMPDYGAPAAAVGALAAAWPAALLTRNALGNMPLHVAAKWGASRDVLSALLAAPGGAMAAGAPGEGGALPLELAHARAVRGGGPAATTQDPSIFVMLRAALAALAAPPPADGEPEDRSVWPDPSHEARLAQAVRELARPVAPLKPMPQHRPQGGLLLLGSSVMAYWPAQHAAASFPFLPAGGVSNCGVPGCEARHMAAWAWALVAPHAPRVLLVYVGGNDVANGASGRAVGMSVRAFLRAARVAAPGARAVLLGIILAPSKLSSPSVAAALLAANEALRAVAAAESAAYVNPQTPGAGGFLRAADGQPRKELFTQDGLHLSPSGYDTLRELLRRPVADAWATAGDGAPSQVV